MPHFDTYIGSQRKMASRAAAAGATVLMSNHSEFDNAVTKIKMLPGRYYLKSGMYGGLRGWAQGDDKGPLHVEHDRWDLGDPEIRRLVRTLSDHVIEVTVGDQVGYGIVEYGVGKGYARYAEVQDHPPI